ncbi:MAG: hypothetical protein J7K77_00795 [Dehalococcoidales bacterium]|nr:hypothetical protein [Dehalococcoidales bacterium]
MDKREELKKALGELTGKAEEILNLAANAQKGDFLRFGAEYQNWYTMALKVVEVLANDRLGEFISYYKINPKRQSSTGIDAQDYVIQDFIMGTNVRSSIFDSSFDSSWTIDTSKVTAVRVHNQLQILQSLETRIDSVLSDVQGSLLAELQDKELETAEELLKINLRSAGSLAGVILENHLQKVMQNHNIPISKKNPTISDMNDPLKSNNIYDVPIWRKIQYLADIRNLCSHKKDREPTEAEVKELISGVNEIIKKVF